jgi:hypothetical protein
MLTASRQSGFRGTRTHICLLACSLAGVFGSALETACSQTDAPIEYRFEVLGFEQSHVLDPAQGEFRSKQDLQIRNATETTASLVVFNSHPSLLIANLTVTDATGAQIAQGPPRKRGETRVFRDYIFDVWEVYWTTDFPGGYARRNRLTAPRL